MQKTLSLLRKRYDLKITAINLIGVSLGALQGAYLSVIDDDGGKIGIAKYLLVNPPVDLFYAVRKLDEWNALRDKFDNDKSQAIVAKAIAIVNRSPTREAITPRSLKDWLENSPVSPPKNCNSWLR